MKVWTVIGFSLLVACAKSKDSTDPQPAPPAAVEDAVEDLSGKPAPDVLKTKYDSAVLTCSLWVQRGSELVTTVSPTDSFSWDLISDFAYQNTFKLAGEVRDHSLEVVINVEAVEIFGEVNLTTVDGSKYIMSNTPVVKLRFQTESTTHLASNFSGAGTGSGFAVVYEGVKDMVLNQNSSGGSSEVKFFNFLECTINAVIKPDYQDQFKVEPAS